MTKKDETVIEVKPGDGPNADQITALQNRINDLTLELSEIRKGKSDDSAAGKKQADAILADLKDLRAEMASLKTGAAHDDDEDTTEDGGCYLGYFS